MDNLRAIALMCVAMACFALEDLVIKLLAETLPTWQIFILMGGTGAALFAVICRARGVPLFTRAFLTPLVILRNMGEVIGGLGFVTALTLVPLSLATAILQATPLALTAGAAIFLGERVGWRRWVAVLIGFVGILVVLDPFSADFEPAALLAVVGVLGLVMRDLATRVLPDDLPSPQISFWAYCCMPISGLILLPWGGAGVMPGAAGWTGIVVAASIGAMGYWAITLAMRLGEVAAVIPFRYTRLIFAMALGIAVLGERPDATTLAGAALVVLTGLYTVWRERKLAAEGREVDLSPRAEPR
ncbi:DMT family transporter [Palleronia sp. LCG004]|uniref:DMT family transporter n=1 Tax=Palleronia sp. LCG004 TaxID=3079304 RepID=UPI0029438584|nr:DMT family transporter [Palleronia sp. LCG004]WOI55233.1 DMT family transporter [Palleronia sp. LCG004]